MMMRHLAWQESEVLVPVENKRKEFTLSLREGDNIIFEYTLNIKKDDIKMENKAFYIHHILSRVAHEQITREMIYEYLKGE